MYEETLSHPLDFYESRDLIISLLKDTVERECDVLEIKGGNTHKFSTGVH